VLENVLCLGDDEERRGKGQVKEWDGGLYSGSMHDSQY
jgi:hypothetical protein